MLPAIFHINDWGYFKSNPPARWLSRYVTGAKPAPPGQTAAPEPSLRTQRILNISSKRSRFPAGVGLWDAPLMIFKQNKPLKFKEDLKGYDFLGYLSSL